MRIRTLVISLVGIVFCSFGDELTAQTDNRLWSSFRIRKQINQKMHVDVRPIVRLDQHVSRYRNASVDISLKRQLDKGWFIQGLARTFFIPNAPHIQFLWLDIGHVYKNSQVSILNRTRFHYALDLADTNQRDFVRHIVSIAPVDTEKVRPVFAIEPWFQLDGINKVTRIRYQLGLLIPKFGSYNLSLWYWRQKSLNEEPATSQNIYVATLSYKL